MYIQEMIGKWIKTSFIPLTLLAIGVIPHDIASNKDTGHPSPFLL